VNAGTEWFEALLDDAAVFPPGNAPLETALEDHDRHRTSEHAFMVGSLVIPDTALPELARLVATRSDPVGVNLVVSGGAGAIEPALTYAGRSDGLQICATECAARDDNLVAAVRRIVAMTEASIDDVSVWVELPPLTEDVPTPGWLAGLDELATTGYGFKFRTGGVSAEAFPTETQLARVIDSALDRELVTKFTAGLHNAVRYRDSDGFEHHGFVNVLNAFEAARAGAGPGDVEALLGSRDGPALAQRLRDRDQETAMRTRRAFASFGTCSILEPVDDLADLGWTWKATDR
jgi:hypothetical protein